MQSKHVGRCQLENGSTVIESMTIDIAQCPCKRVHKAWLMIYKNLSVVHIILLVSVISGLVFEKIYELFVGTNKTAHYIAVSVLSANP